MYKSGSHANEKFYNIGHRSVRQWRRDSARQRTENNARQDTNNSAPPSVSHSAQLFMSSSAHLSMTRCLLYETFFVIIDALTK
jgi:hypothetical protein